MNILSKILSLKNVIFSGIIAILSILFYKEKADKEELKNNLNNVKDKIKENNVKAKAEINKKNAESKSIEQEIKIKDMETDAETNRIISKNINDIKEKINNAEKNEKPKKRGRPKGSKNKPKVQNKKSEDVASDEITVQSDLNIDV